MSDNIMPMNGQNENRHIVDRLAECRDQITYLKGVENELKEKINWQMGSRMSLGGDDYIAVKVIAQRAGSIDVKLLEQDGIDIEKYRKPPSATTTIRLEERNQEARSAQARQGR